MNSNQPWLDPSLEREERVRLLLRALTREEKIALINGHIGSKSPGRAAPPDGALGSAGFVPGVPRLGVPDQQETDASLGVANLHDGVGATALPSGLAIAATWNEDLAEAGGAMIGAEARAKGFNVMLAGGCNLTREPRCGRNFEYLGEDPLLAGVMVGASIRGVQSNQLVATIKHFALNAQETGRMSLSANIDEAPLRESDLLAFQIGIERGRPGSVMTAYNRVNGIYCGEHDWLLNTVLKGDWGFDGYTMSDWGGCHSGAKAAKAGLDRESGQELDREPFFQKLGEAIDQGALTEAKLDDMTGRLLRALIGAGALDGAPAPTIDRDAHLDVARRTAEEVIVLLKNDALLPLPRSLSRIAVIGGHADIGVLAGGGSSSVVPWGGFAKEIKPANDTLWAPFLRQRWLPSAPLAALRAAAPEIDFAFDDGADPARAAALAASCDVALVFAEQWTSEFIDVPNLSLPDGQDALIAAVARANPRTAVVLITGGPVLAPWRDAVGAILAAWYPGARGGEAIAAIVFGDVNPSGRLPITFPADEADLPNPALPGADLAKETPFAKFDVTYPEGADVGYRWFASRKRPTLFPFGHGLSYTSFAYSELTLEGGEALAAHVLVTNVGARAGAETVQFYVTNRPGGAALRLIGWGKAHLQPGESRRVSIAADPRVWADYDPVLPGWRVAGGSYGVAAGASCADLRLHGAVALAASSRRP